MRFLWPEVLWLAMLVPCCVAGHALLLRRRSAAVGDRAREFLARNRLAGPSRRWRYVTPALLMSVLVLLVVAAARPTATLALPSQQRTVILAMDVSGSMEAPDVAPNRIGASQAAAKAFAARLPRSVRVGVVAYADSAQLVQPPTLRREDVLAAIDRFQLQQGTAIGSGILVSLGAIFPGQFREAADGGERAHKAARPLVAQRPDAMAGPPPVPPGSYASAVIVLLTDGQNTIGPEPVEAAQIAASRGVKVYTVGFGTRDGQSVDVEGFSIVVRLDEDTLMKVAEITHAQYFHAGSGVELDHVYEGLQSKLVVERQDTEVTALFAGAAALLLVLAAATSVWRHGAIV